MSANTYSKTSKGMHFSGLRGMSRDTAKLMGPGEKCRSLKSFLDDDAFTDGMRE